jgi:hypothetical protein
VDPSFRVVMRGADGRALTREELADPATITVATRNLSDYNPSYTFDNVLHIRLARLHILGSLLRRILDRTVPGWEDTPKFEKLIRASMSRAWLHKTIIVNYSSLSAYGFPSLFE